MKNILLTAFICCALNISSNELDPIDLLKDFVAVDTINPPGNEINAVRFYAEIFDQYGISYQVAESAPGRGNICLLYTSDAADE